MIAETRTYGLDPIEIMSSSVSFSDHISQLQILCLDIPLHPFHSINRLLRRIRLQLHTLVFAQHFEMFVSELRVELGERFVLVPPESDLVL